MKSNDPNSIDAPESDYLFVQTSCIPNAGDGLFTAIKIFPDEIIAFFEGEILSEKEAATRAAKGEDAYFMVLRNGKILDCMHTEGFAKKANDASGVMKTGFKNNAKITLDEDQRVCLVATKTIKESEEIYCSYGKKYWNKHGV